MFNYSKGVKKMSPKKTNRQKKGKTDENEAQENMRHKSMVV